MANTAARLPLPTPRTAHVLTQIDVLLCAYDWNAVTAVLLANGTAVDANDNSGFFLSSRSPLFAWSECRWDSAALVG